MKVQSTNRVRGRYQRTPQTVRFTKAVIYLEPGLLLRLRGLAQFKNMTVSAVGAAMLADALGKSEVNHAPTPAAHGYNVLADCARIAG